MSKMDIGLPILAWSLAVILSKIGSPAAEDGMVVIEAVGGGAEVIGYMGMVGDDKKFGGGRGMILGRKVNGHFRLKKFIFC